MRICSINDANWHLWCWLYEDERFRWSLPDPHWPVTNFADWLRRSRLANLLINQNSTLKSALIVANTAGTKPKRTSSANSRQVICVASQKVEKLIFQAAEESTAGIAAATAARARTSATLVGTAVKLSRL